MAGNMPLAVRVSAVSAVESVEEMTAEWLTAALREAKFLTAEQSVTSCTAERFGVGVAMLSDLGRLSVTYSDGGIGLPLKLVAKAAATTAAKEITCTVRTHDIEHDSRG